MPKVLGGGCGLWMELENDSSIIKVKELRFCSKINLLAIGKAFFWFEEGVSLQLLSICNVQETSDHRSWQPEQGIPAVPLCRNQ